MSHRLKIDGQVDWVNPVNWLSSLNRGLVSWWLALPGVMGGSKFLDLARRNDGTLTNGPTWGGALGRLGGHGALNFVAASNTSVQCGNNASLAPTTGLTVCGWIRPTTVSTAQNICEKGTSSLAKQFYITVTAAAALRMVVNFSGGGGQTGGGTVVVNTWQFFAVTCDNVTWRLYLDRTEVATLATGSADNTQNFQIGDGSDGNFAGAIDGIRLYDRALSASELIVLRTEELRGYPTTLNRIRQPVGVEAAVAPGGTILPLMNHYLAG